MRVWLKRSSVTQGRLSRSLRKDGQVVTKLDDSLAPRIYKGMARAAGLDDAIDKCNF